MPMSMTNTSLNHTAYYAKIDELFAVATATVIGFCLLALPIMPFTSEERWQFALVLASATILFLVRYIWLKPRMGADARFYITDFINPLTVGLLVFVSGDFGLFLYFLFFLNLVGSISLLKFRHVAINATIVAYFTVYFFILTDTFGLGESERYVAGGVVLMVLGLSTVFTYELIHEMVNQLAAFEIRKMHFIQDVSHELRTPLTVIKATAGLLRDPRVWLRQGDGKSQEMIEHLESATTDLEKITEKLSDDTRKVTDQHD
jgi:signal transduction histidine kinase